jgi:hypothetical protein
MASHHGEFVNPVGSWRVAHRVTEVGADVYFIEVMRKEVITVNGNEGEFFYWSPHTSGNEWAEQEDAEEFIEATEAKYEEDYDEYLEENRYEIAQMERYEMWRREY